MNRYEGKAGQDFFLPRLSTKEIKDLDKERGLVVLPVGAIEQHGAHLPVYTDTLIAEGLLSEIFEHLSEEHQVWLLPIIPYGKSNEHLGHPGVMSVSAAALQQVILDIGRSVKASGFRRMVIFNSHGGNSDLLNMMAREVRIETGLMVFRLNGMDFMSEIKYLFTDQELISGIHGGDVETSIVLALEEQWVNMSLATNELFNKIPDIGLKGGPYAAWTIDDISSSGILGCATDATAEKGMQALKLLGSKMAKVLIEMSEFEMERFKSTNLQVAIQK